MDRLTELSDRLSNVLTDLRDEANRRDLEQLAPPLAWLDEAHRWLRYEMVRATAPVPGDVVPFAYVAVDFRASCP